MIGRDKIVNNLSFMAIVQLLNYIFPIITIPIVARALGPELLGFIGYTTAIVAYFIIIVNYGFDLTAVRRASRLENDDDLNKIFSQVIFSKFILCMIASIIFYGCYLLLWQEQELSLLYLITYLSCLALVFNCNWVFQYKQNLKFVAILSFIFRCISTFFIILMIKEKSDILIYALVINLVNFLTFFCGFYVVKYKYKLSFSLPYFSNCIQIMKEDRFIFYSAVITNLYTSTGIVLLGYFVNKTEVGFYTSAQSIIFLAQNVVLGALNPVFYPIYARAFHEDTSTAIELIKRILPVNIFISLIVLLMLLLFGPLAVYLMYGVSFMPSISILLILSFGLFLKFYGAVFGGQIMLNLNMDSIFVRIQMFVSIFSVLLNILGLYFGFKATWVALVWVLSEFLITLAQYFYLRYKGYSLLSWNMLRLSSLRQGLNIILGKNTNA